MNNLVLFTRALLPFTLSTLISAQQEYRHILYHPILRFKSTTSVNLTSYISENIVFFLEGQSDEELIVLTRSRVFLANITNPSSPNFQLVAGSTQYYYVEGQGEAARFNKLVSAIKFNDTHILVTDSSNFVIRMIEIYTGQTSLYSGAPNRAGYRNGRRLDSRFRYPYGIVQAPVKSAGIFIVSDQSDSSIRKIEGDTVSKLLKKQDGKFFPGYMIIQLGYIYATVPKGLVKFSLIGPKDVEYLVGITEAPARYYDGDFYGARFSNLYNLAVYPGSSLFLADHENKAVRLANLPSYRVFTICLIRPTQYNVCENNYFGQPLSLLLKNNKILVSFESGPSQNTTPWLTFFGLFNGTLADTTTAITEPETTVATTKDQGMATSPGSKQTTTERPEQVSTASKQTTRLTSRQLTPIIPQPATFASQQPTTRRVGITQSATNADTQQRLTQTSQQPLTATTANFLYLLRLYLKENEVIILGVSIGVVLLIVALIICICACKRKGKKKKIGKRKRASRKSRLTEEKEVPLDRPSQDVSFREKPKVYYGKHSRLSDLSSGVV